MSYDIRLCDPVTHIMVEFPTAHVMTGGTYQAMMDVHGNWIPRPTTEAWLNITYNYSGHYKRVFEPRPARPGENEEYGTEDDAMVCGIRSIYGLTGAESIPILQRAADQLNDETDPDYWEPTEGNAKRPLLQLIAMAQLRPDGIWEGD